MAVTALDTHQVVKRLRGAGFTDEQAETVTAVILEAHETSLADVATRADLQRIEAKLESLEQRIEAKLESFEQRMEAKSDGFEQRIEARSVGFEQRIDAKLESLEQRMTIKLGGMLVVAIGIVAALVKVL